MADQTGGGSGPEVDSEHYDTDEFAYVALAFLTCVALPLTLSAWRAAVKARRELARRVAALQCSCAGCGEKRTALAKDAAQWRPKQALYYAGLALLWLLWALALTAVLRQTTQETTTVFDPFEILGVQSDADESVIKRAYKKASIKWHPDKNRDNREEAERMFIEVTRAYKTLTDETARKNWLEYGNPDGPQGFAMGIALPAWLVDSGNSVLVLLGYVFFVLVALPYGAVSLWNSWRYLAPNELLYNTMYTYSAGISIQRSKLTNLFELLAASEEFSKLPMRAGDNEALVALHKELKSNAKDEKPHPEGVEEPQFRKRPYIVKSTLLLHAHVSRLHDQVSPSLRADIAEIASKTPALVDGMLSILQSKRSQGPVAVSLVQAIMSVSPTVVQACWPSAELLQLPHVSAELNKTLAKKRVKTLRELIAEPAESRRRTLVGSDLKSGTRDASLYLTNEQVVDVEAVLSRMPLHVAVDAEVKVEDEVSFISPDAIVSIFVRCERVATAAEAKARSQVVVADADNVAALVAAGVKLTGTAALVAKEAAKKALADAKTEKGRKAAARLVASDGLVTEDDSESAHADADDADDEDDDDDDGWAKDDPALSKKVDVPDVFAHCPYVPQSHKDSHWVFLSDARKCLGSSVKKVTINTGEHDKEIVKLMFQAPPRPGKHAFELNIVSDSYHGCNKTIPFTLLVHPAPEPVAVPIDDEVWSDDELSMSDDDEDDDVDDK